MKMKVVVFSLLLSSMVMANVTDYIYEVGFDEKQVLDVDGLSVRYAFGIEIVTSPVVSKVVVATPAGQTLVMLPGETCSGNICTETDLDDGVLCWYLDYDASVPGDGIFGEGNYDVKAYYNTAEYASTTVTTFVPGTTTSVGMPATFPQILAPTRDGEAANPVTVQWQSVEGPNVNSVMIECEGTESWYGEEFEDIAVDDSEYTIGNLDLGEYWLSLRFTNTTGRNFNSDGVLVESYKDKMTTLLFRVIPTYAYEVWGSDDSYFWYDMDPEYYGLELLGTAGVETAIFSGSYPYYVIASVQPVGVDAVQMSDGSFLAGNWLETGNTENYNRMFGSPDGETALVGFQSSGSYYAGFAVIPNSTNAGGITVHVGKTCSNRPLGDLDNDCSVGLGDLAILAANWMECGFYYQNNCP